MFLEIAAKACGGDDSGETTIEVVSTAACVPGCEDGDLFCEEIYADSCEDPNTNEPNTGPMVPPGIYAPTGNFRYTDSNPLPGWAPFLTDRVVDSMNDDAGVFGRGWFSVFDASVEDVFPDLTEGKYYRVTTEENLNVYFREEGGTYHQVWPSNRPVGSLEAVADLDGDNEPEFAYTEPDGGYIRRFDSNSGFRLSNIQDVRSGKSIQISYDPNGAPESVVRVTQGSGAVTDYYIRPVPGGPDKVTMIKGECTGCGGTGDFNVMGYDAFGKLVRKQDAMGAITVWTYDPVGRVIDKTGGFSLDAPACEPLGSPYCYVSGETELMDENTVLYDAGVTTATYTYDDWDWR